MRTAKRAFIFGLAATAIATAIGEFAGHPYIGGTIGFAFGAGFFMGTQTIMLVVKEHISSGLMDVNLLHPSLKGKYGAAAIARQAVNKALMENASQSSKQ